MGLIVAMENDQKRMIQEAIANQTPAMLKKVFKPGMTGNDMLTLRKHIADIAIEPRFYKTVFDWLWHNDTEIARSAGVLALWIGDLGFQAELFNHLTQIGRRKIPFIVDYNSAEKEFNIEIPGIPGWCVSHYGRDNPDVDLLLHALEKFYIYIHPEGVPPHFRQ